jgi:ligand-binding sensor domain-containing protein/two-component sensor histidine kinase
MRVHRFASICVCVVLGLMAALPLCAADNSGQPNGYALTAWTTERGLPPGDVLVMTQDLDGYLWVGTTSGLARFDGLQFSLWGTHGEPALPVRSVPALIGAHDGSLWIGFGNPGGVSRFRNGQIVHYSEQDGLPRGAIAALIEDRHGTVWAGGAGGLSRFADDRWEPMVGVAGLPAAEISTLYEDQRGVLWVGGAAGVYRRETTTFELVDSSAAYPRSLGEDGAGTMWVTDLHRIVRKVRAANAPPLPPDVRLPAAGWRLLHDRDGSLWVASWASGLLRIRKPAGGVAPVVERFAYESKIGGSPRSLFEDMDGNIWVGMRGGGLLRVSESVLQNDIPLDGLTTDGVRALSSAGDGSVWVATEHNLHHFSGSARKVYSLSQTIALHTDQTGTVWAATTQDVVRVVGDRVQTVGLPQGLRFDSIASITTDPAGGLWLCHVNQQGLMRWSGGRLSRFEDVPDVFAKPCGYTYTDRRGRVWVGFIAGGVGVYEDGHFRMHDEKSGLVPGRVVAISEDRKGSVWVSSVAGLSRFQNGRFTTLTTVNGPFAGVVPTLVEDNDGYIWMGVNAGAGLMRLNPAEIDKVATNRSHEVEYRLYDASDGLPGDFQWTSRPAAVRAGDGRIWLATRAGASVIDPRQLPRIHRPAPPRIDRVVVDGRAIPSIGNIELPARTSNLQVDYGTLSLSAATKLRYRYMLEGVNPEWVDAGARRQATFANVPPGRYRLRVSATNDGLWTEARFWDFSIAPPFYKTNRFYALCLISLLLALGSTWWLRLRAVQHQFALVIAERARVSREIHDTLLQSLSAIGLELETIASQLDPSQQFPRDSLRRLRQDVRRSVREARESIMELRSTRVERRDLAEALRDLAARTKSTEGVQLAVAVEVSGQPRRCSAETEDELLRIGQEAVSNAVRHGRATKIEVALDYGEDALSLRVSDDGAGFVPAGFPAGTGAHLGLMNMKERAEKIGGHVRISSQPGHGTAVLAVAPLSSPSAAERSPA